MAFVLSLAAVAWAAEPQDKSGASGFPAPDRPVASIISPEYSNEKTRDGHGEAERVLNLLGIRPGQRVADVGAGLGYYTVRIARRLGPGATVYATDVKSEYLDQLRDASRGNGSPVYSSSSDCHGIRDCPLTPWTWRCFRTCITRSRIPTSSSIGSSPR